jgi:hypothetical protein
MKTNSKMNILFACLAGVCLFSSQANAGILIGLSAEPPASVDLTAEGTLDWAHWGLNDETSFDHKATGGDKIGNVTITDAASTGQGNAAVATSWSDGTPNPTATDTDSFLEQNNGRFQFTVPASTTSQMLKVYVQAWNTVLHFEARLSDASAPPYVDETLDTGGDNDTQYAYTVVFAAGTPGQTLTVEAYDVGGSGDAWFGIASATLQSAPPPPTAMGASTQVQSVAVYDGSEASFSFAATNDSPSIPVLYQWYKNGQVVTNVTGNYFTFWPARATLTRRCCVATPWFNPNNLSLRSATGTVTVLPGLIYTNGLKVEFFSGASRQDVEAGNVGPATSISLASSFEMPVDADEDYTRRVSGYFLPPTSGNYVFFVCSDDDSDLFLSTDSDPAHKRLIAQETGWSDPRQWVSSAGASDLP